MKKPNISMVWAVLSTNSDGTLYVLYPKKKRMKFFLICSARKNPTIPTAECLSEPVISLWISILWTTLSMISIWSISVSTETGTYWCAISKKLRKFIPAWKSGHRLGARRLGWKPITIMPATTIMGLLTETVCLEKKFWNCRLPDSRCNQDI